MRTCLSGPAQLPCTSASPKLPPCHHAALLLNCACRGARAAEQPPQSYATDRPRRTHIAKTLAWAVSRFQASTRLRHSAHRHASSRERTQTWRACASFGPKAWGSEHERKAAKTREHTRTHAHIHAHVNAYTYNKHTCKHTSTHPTKDEQ